MVLVHLQPVVIVIVCHAIATDGGVGGVLDHGLCLAWIHVSVSVLLGWSLDAIVFGSIRWCVWSVRPSSPLRLPHLKCLLLLFSIYRVMFASTKKGQQLNHGREAVCPATWLLLDSQMLGRRLNSQFPTSGAA